MTRRVFVRPRVVRRASFAVAVSMALSLGLSPLLPSASAAPAGSAAETPQETVVPATLRSTTASASLFDPSTEGGTDGAGAQGVFHRLEGAGLVWTRYADGNSVPVPTDKAALMNTGTGSDNLAYDYPNGRIKLWDAVDGTMRTLQVPQGQELFGVYGTTAVTFTPITADDGTITGVNHLLTSAPDGTTHDVPLEGLPPGTQSTGPRVADGTSLLFLSKWDNALHIVMVNRADGSVQGWSPPLPSGAYNEFRLSKNHILVSADNNTKVLVLSRADLSAPPAELVLDSAGAVNPTEDLTVIGDWVVHRPNTGTAVLAQPLDGGATVTLIGRSVPGLSSSSDDSAVVVGGTGTDDWGVQRITPGADGRPVVTTVKPLPRLAAEIQGLSLEQGRLIESDPISGEREPYLRTVSGSGTPEFGDRSRFIQPRTMASCAVQDAGCSAIQGTADGRVVWMERGQASGPDVFLAYGPGQSPFSRSVPAGGRITDVSGNYLIYSGPSEQYVYKLANDGVPVTVAKGAAAIYGELLLTAGSTPGTVTSFDLPTRTPAETLTTDAKCVPEELQAVGRWLYWSCGPGGEAGVFDRVAKKSVPVPSGEAELGDGYVVTHDKAAGKLTLTSVTDGRAVGRVIGDLPDTGVSQRDVRWTVDKAGTNAAYVDAQERVHLVPSGVSPQPLSLLASPANAPYVRATTHSATPDALTKLVLSKPSAQWTLTVRNGATGKVVDTEQGGAASGGLSIGWHGINPSLPGEVFFQNGRFDWSLSVTPADGIGAPLTVTGSVQLTDGADVWRDLGMDGIGDLLAQDSTGQLYTYQGSGTGGVLLPRQAGTGTKFPATAQFVPYGDTDDDGCNDVLVRLGDELRAYRPGCGLTVSASSLYTLVGTGWAQFDMLTSPGDLNGDGYIDLVARQTTTGDMYLYPGTATHRMAARIRIGTNWKQYSKIVGAGDLNGDGRGDLLGIDTSGDVWRYDGQATGALTPRVQIASGWGATYTTVVGMGDITGDGYADIVARDTAGKLYRHSGTGTGTLAGGTVIGTSGWSVFKNLY